MAVSREANRTLHAPFRASFMYQKLSNSAHQHQPNRTILHGHLHQCKVSCARFLYKFLERVSSSLTKSNLASSINITVFTARYILVQSAGLSEQSLLKFWRKGSVGVSIDCPNFLGTPYYLRTSNFVRAFDL